MNAEADMDPKALRISMDTKATIKVGDYSRGGRSRGNKAVAALDHDMHANEKLTPGGIMETNSGKVTLFFTDSHKTSDFLVDGLKHWWSERHEVTANIERLIVNMDNGPECNGHRSQFLLRMVEFADMTGIEIHLVYYPPYHSKYNKIEHYWGGLERSWNGYLLDTVQTVLTRAANFAWKGTRTTVTMFDRLYRKGVKVCGKNKKEVEARIQRSEHLPWWDITIAPKVVF